MVGAFALSVPSYGVRVAGAPLSIEVIPCTIVPRKRRVELNWEVRQRITCRGSAALIPFLAPPLPMRDALLSEVDIPLMLSLNNTQRRCGVDRGSGGLRQSSRDISTARILAHKVN